MPPRLFTIGFTKSDARHFFGRLRDAGVKRLIDIRLNNVSQLAGFAKHKDLEFFMQELCGAEYRHVPQCAPTEDMLKAYREDKAWPTYEQAFRRLIAQRRIETLFTPATLNGACLLCSEPTAEHCHRHVVAEYLKAKLGPLEIIHL